MQILLVVVLVYSLTSIEGHSIPPTNGQIGMNFILNVAGQSEDGLVTYKIVNNVGTFEVRGETYNAIAYYTQVMGDPSSPLVRWFDLIGVSETSNNLAVVYIGCNPPPDTNSVTIVWEEDFFNQLTSDYPVGNVSCDFTDLSGKPNFQFNVELPALKGLPTTPISTGITIYGSEKVYLNDTFGWIIVEKVNYTIIPITTVDCDDCGRNCLECPPAPWYELHFIYYTETPSPQTGFGIFYIYPYNQTFVQLNYTLTLPTLDQPAITYTANWSGTIPTERSISIPPIVTMQEPTNENKKKFIN